MTTRVCLVLSALFVAPAAFADTPPEKIDAKGKPKDFKPGLSPRYAVWYDDAGWHFHVTTNTAGATEFSGRIDVVGGKISIDLKDPPKAGGPKARPPAPKKGADGKKEPELKMESKGYNFSYKVNRGVENAMRFHPEPDVTALTFDLKINGKAADPEAISIGAKGEHPKSATFTLTVTPAKTK